MCKTPERESQNTYIINETQNCCHEWMITRSTNPNANFASKTILPTLNGGGGGGGGGGGDSSLIKGESGK
jgi:hypothetical protein